MFFLLALAVWGGMHAYVLWRVHGLAFVRRRVPRRVVAVAGTLLALAYVAARIVEALGFSRSGLALEWVGALWIGVLVIALGCFFVADLVTGFGILLRERVQAIRTAALVATLVLTAVALVNALRPPVVRDHEVRMANLPAALDGTVVVVLSDLHVGSMTTSFWVEGVLSRVASLHPDLILLAGDLSEGHSIPPGLIAGTYERFRAPLGVWAVPGNHEAHRGGGDADLLGAGVRVLRDASAGIAPGLYLAGVDTAGHERLPGRGVVAKALAGVPPAAATILLAHYPEQVEEASARGVGLMLSGHTHAGQIWPFNYFVRMAYRYVGGRYDVGPMTLLVCRGTGTWGPPMRLFRPNEVLRVVLRRG